MKFQFLKALNHADEKYIEEVLQYDDSSRSERSYKMRIFMKFTAAAACAALILGAGAFAFGRSGDPHTPPISPAAENMPDGETAEPNAASKDSVEIVEVEPTYNERIASGETVTVETHIGERIEHQNFAFTLKDITVSPTFPEGITKADIACSPAVAAYASTGDANEVGENGYTQIGYESSHYDYSEYAAEHGLPPIESEEGCGSEESGGGRYTARSLEVIDVVDENGLYQGPMDVPDEAYKWVFLELEIENLTDEEQVEYMADMELNGGDLIEHPMTALCITEDGEPIIGPHPYSFYSYETSVSYMSEHTDRETYSGQAEGYKFHNLCFEPKETKTLILGYSVSDHFVYGDLFLKLHNSETFTMPDGFIYLPLK